MARSQVKSQAGVRTARPAPAARTPGSIGAWQPVNLLGSGNWSQVFAARPVGSSTELSPAYVVKVLRDEHVDDARALELLCREARVGRKVSHQHVVPVLQAELHAAPYYLVMPRLAGHTLAERLARGWQPALPEALWIVRQIAEGLAALEESGWLHADVKPANIMVSPTGHATLVDLGFARRVEEMTSIADRPVLGTIEYLAPEMLIAREPADIRSDVYSLGVTLFEMLALRRPFVANNLAQLAALHRTAAAEDVRTFVPQLPAAVARLVREMLAKQRLRRPDPREVVVRLTALEIETFDERPLVEIV